MGVDITLGSTTIVNVSVAVNEKQERSGTIFVMSTSATKSLYLLLTIGPLLSLPHSARCQSTTARQQIRAALQKADTSFRHKNISGCLAMLTDDFQGTDIRGTQFNKSQTRPSLAREFSSHPLIKRSEEIKSQVLDVKSSGQRAAVVYHEHLVITIAGQTTHEQHVLTLDANRRSIWVQGKDGWREQTETQITPRITQDSVLKSVKDGR